VYTDYIVVYKYIDNLSLSVSNIKFNYFIYVMDIDNEVELIVAFSKNGIIGNKNQIPWDIPEDLKRFRDLTINNIVVMGRKTFESLPSGPLKNRINIILTNKVVNVKDENNPNPNVIYANADNISTIIKNINQPYKSVFIIGGSEIYKLFINYCKIIHITYIDEDFDGDAYFPYDINYFIDNYKLITSKKYTSEKQNIKYKYYTFYNKT